METPGLLEVVTNAVEESLNLTEKLPPHLARLVEASKLWAQGCGSLEEGEPSAALAAFDEAARLAPWAPTYPLSAALALGFVLLLPTPVSTRMVRPWERSK